MPPLSSSEPALRAAPPSSQSGLLTGPPLLSIVIVSWNTRDILRDCLKSLVECTPLDFEVIVVDNASADDSVEMLRRELPQVRVLANDYNAGFARACNQGMRASRSEFILLLNSDTYVRDDVIARMVRYMEERPDVAMSSCQLRYPDGRLQHTAERSLSIWKSLFEDLWLYKLVPPATRDDILLGPYWSGDSEKEVDWLAGAFMLLRRDVFQQVGGFAEDFFMYGEDSEWCMRIRKAGGKIVYAPLGVVYHIGSVSSDIEWSQRERLRLCHIGGLRAYAKINGPLRGRLYHLAKLLGTSVRYAVYAAGAALRPNEYYREKCQLYGWQMGFYREALALPEVRGAALTGDTKQDMSTPENMATEHGDAATLDYTGERMVPETAPASSFWQHVYRYRFARKFVRGKRVLDIASGEGYGTASLLKGGAASVVGVDISEAACAHACKKYGVDARPGGAEAIPLPDESVDVVVSFETIEHLPAPEPFLDECLRVLVPGGLLIVSTPNRDVYSEAGQHNSFHCHEMNEAEFTALLRPRFAGWRLYTQWPKTAAWTSLRSLAAEAPPWLVLRGLGRLREIVRSRICPHIRGSLKAGYRQRPVETILARDHPYAHYINPYVVRPQDPRVGEQPGYFVALARKPRAPRPSAPRPMTES